MDVRAVVVAAVALLAVSAQGIQQRKVYKLHVLSEIRNRYAKTLITSKVGNTATHAQEISFDAVLPQDAFVSRFVIEMDGVAYEAYVRGKEEARQEYDAAVAQGRGAAHVAVSARDSNVVHVSVNVEPQKKVTFNLTYEELLQRELGAYSLRININPRQLVDDLAVEVRIEEQVPLRLVEVPTLKETNEISDYLDNTTEPLAHVERPTPSSARVRWAPTKQQQLQRREGGISGQLVVRYDVDRDFAPSQILVSEDGYFVHFYAPPGLPPLPKHVVFVLDVSGSMEGRKIEQLKTAMHTILDELNPGDVFSLIPFSTEEQVWHPDVPLTFESRWTRKRNATFNHSAIVEATSDNILKAKRIINSFEADGATYMYSALLVALRVADAGAATGGGGSAPGHRRHAPMLLLLTDGAPNGLLDDTNEIVRRVTERNAHSGAAIFTLAFGENAVYSFLRRLALRNSGLGRKIYEAADADLQLRNFYRKISSPLLADVSFNYDSQQVDEESLTALRFPTLFGGGELVVAGRLSPGTREPWCAVRSREGNATAAVPQPAVANVTSAERLWAYLTVRQLLDQDAAASNHTVRARAKELALRYSFVTSVTSLVVVKPDETSAVNLDEADAPREASVPAPRTTSAVYVQNALRVSSHQLPSYQLGQGHSLHAQMPDFDWDQLLSQVQHQITYTANMEGALSRFDSAAQDTGFSDKKHTFVFCWWIDNLLVHCVELARSHIQEQEDHFMLHPEGILYQANYSLEGPLTLDDIAWLGPLRNGSEVTLSVNGTEQHFQLALDQTGDSFQNCSSPAGTAGACRHLAACVLQDFTHSLDVFLSGWLCVVQASFLGVCCPHTS